MSERYKVVDNTVPTFITMTTVGWVDLFIRRRYHDILNESLAYCIENKGLTVHAYVYMTNHIHLIVSSQDKELSDIVRDFKKFTSKRLIEAIQDQGESRSEWMLKKFQFEAKRSGRAENYKLWQDGFHPVILDTKQKREQRVRYIHYNPVDAGFVQNERDWLNSSYLAYEEEDPLLNIEVSPLW
ncbi:MAG: transposase [Crocinitomicaceae bacterium]|nr:transposase [Crocinitomicaceae bacterium]